MPLNFDIHDIAIQSINDSQYAKSIARWIHSRIENSLKGIDVMTGALDEDETTIEQYLSSFSSDITSIMLGYFPQEDDQAGNIATVADVSRALAGVELSGDVSWLTYDKAEYILKDVADSVAASEAGVTAIEMADAGIVKIDEYVANLEAQYGGISDAMLGMTALIKDSFLSDNLSLPDKVRTVLEVLGWINTSYNGLGLPDTQLSNYTGVSGLSAAGDFIAGAVQDVIGFVSSVVLAVGSFIDKVTNGFLSRISRKVNQAIEIVTGVGDAFDVREDGSYSEEYCDNCPTVCFIPKTAFSQAFISKLSANYMLHTYGPCCSIDYYLATAEAQGQPVERVCVAFHWKPIDFTVIEKYNNEVSWDILDLVSQPLQPIQYCTAFYDQMMEYETQDDRDHYLDNIGDLLATVPRAIDLNPILLAYVKFNVDMSIAMGIKCAQILFMNMVRIAYDGQASVEDFEEDVDGLELSFASMFTDSVGAINFVTNGTAAFGTQALPQGEVWFEPRGHMMKFIQDIAEKITNFDAASETSVFYPYWYTAITPTGKYHIYEDNEVRSVVSNIFKIAAIIFIAVIGLKLFMAVRKKLFRQRASLDYKLFEKDMALTENKASAEELFKMSKKLDLIDKVTNSMFGTVKGAISTIASKISSVASSLSNVGSQNVRGSTDEVVGPDLSKVEKIIAGY